MSILLAATLGSLAGTFASILLVGDLPIPGSDPTFRFALATMFFTVPGTLLLVAIQFILRARNLSGFVVGLLIVIVGGVTGALMLSAIRVVPEWVAMGALYGMLSAVALLSIQTIPLLSPAAAR